MQRPTMQRPVMDPTFVEKQHKVRQHWLAARKLALLSARWLGRLLVSNPLSVRRRPAEAPVRPTRLLARVAASWLVFLPFLLTATVVVLVYAATHPTAPPTLADPNSEGVFFDPVEFAGKDGTKLTGWLVPALDARRILDQKEKTLKTRSPAAVLVHDFGQSPQQVLPLLLPLHQEGIVELAVALRGEGAGQRAGQTFGLHEWEDVIAAVEVLQSRNFVDPSRIAVIGIGSGANAALLAASHDPNIRAIVLADPFRNCDEAIARKIAPKQRWLRWMQPLCKWTFELSYHVDADDLTLDQYSQLLGARPSLIFNDGDQRIRLLEPATINQVRLFCRRNLHTTDATMASALP